MIPTATIHHIATIYFTSRTSTSVQEINTARDILSTFDTRDKIKTHIHVWTFTLAGCSCSWVPVYHSGFTKYAN